MSQPKANLLSQLLRELEEDVGSSDVFHLVVRSLKDAIKGLKVENDAELIEQFEKLLDVICHTNPKFGIIDYYFRNLAHDLKHTIKAHGNVRKFILQKLDEMVKNAREQRSKILQNSESINVKKKTILIHDHSHTVHAVLRHLRKKKEKFRVIVGEQDYHKTHDNIEMLHAEKIPFQVIPDYMISHIGENVDMVFFGALTLKDTMHFVMEPGAYSVISQFNMMKIPIYAFLNTTKFSLWKSKQRGEIFFHPHKRAHHSKPIEYERLKYSHDRVPVKYFHRIVTNEGILSPTQLEKLYLKKFEVHERKLKNGVK